MFEENPTEERTSRFNQDGKYRSAVGTDDMGAVEGASVSLPQDTENLSDFQEGDEVDITIKGRVGAADEDGKITIEPINIAVASMSPEAKLHRRDTGGDMPPPQTLKKGADEEM